MKKLIMPSRTEGEISAPKSKNLTQRALISAAFARGKSEIINASLSGDVYDVTNLLKTLNVNFKIDILNDEPIIKVNSENFSYGEQDFFCGESAFCVRTAASYLSLSDKQKTITGAKSILNRNFSDLLVLKDLGLEVDLSNEKLPLKLKNRIKPGDYLIDGSHTSQIISGLLFTLPLLEQDSTLEIINPVSKPYLNMTTEILKKFGVRIDYEMEYYKLKFNIPGNQKYTPGEVMIENDWSNSAIMMVIGAIAGDIKIIGMNPESVQGDKMILDVLNNAGANISLYNDSIKIEKSYLNGFYFNATNYPDLVPALIILALNANGKSRISGISRLNNKESRRVEVLSHILYNMGGEIYLYDDEVTINKSVITGGEADSSGDHRIAMALAAAAVNSKNGITINNAEAVSKSYPEFYDELMKLNVGIK